MTKKQIRDDAGKFSTKSGSGGIKTQKEINWTRILPVVLLVAFVGGWLVSSSFAAPRTAPKPGSIEDRQQKSFSAPQAGDVLKPAVSEESRLKDEQNGQFNEHYTPLEETMVKSGNKGMLPTAEYAKCIMAEKSYVTNAKGGMMVGAASYVLRTNGITDQATIQDAKDCGIRVSAIYRCTYYKEKLIRLNGKYAAEYFHKKYPSEAELSSGKIKLSDIMPKEKMMDYYRTEGALMACTANDFSRNTKSTTTSVPYRP